MLNAEVSYREMKKVNGQCQMNIVDLQALLFPYS